MLAIVCCLAIAGCAEPKASAPVVGFYSDWLFGPKWETFHTVELPELLASDYRELHKAWPMITASLR
jgi:hypothetical protein